jgi:hypothetical protein
MGEGDGSEYVAGPVTVDHSVDDPTLPGPDLAALCLNGE